MTVEIHLNGAFVKSTETSYETRKLFSLISKSLISMIIEGLDGGGGGTNVSCQLNLRPFVSC